MKLCITCGLNPRHITGNKGEGVTANNVGVIEQMSGIRKTGIAKEIETTAVSSA
jgi:hypothetical protein